MTNKETLTLTWDWTRMHGLVVMHRRTLYENVDSAKIKVPFYTTDIDILCSIRFRAELCRTVDLEGQRWEALKDRTNLSQQTWMYSTFDWPWLGSVFLVITAKKQSNRSPIETITEIPMVSIKILKGVKLFPYEINTSWGQNSGTLAKTDAMQ